MHIPVCYDPVYQAERREYLADQAEARRAHCASCGDPFFGGERIYRLTLCGQELTLCSFCVTAGLEIYFEEGA